MDKFEKFSLFLAVVLIVTAGCFGEAGAASQAPKPVYTIAQCQALGGGVRYTSSPDQDAQEIAQACVASQFPSLEMTGAAITHQECTGTTDPETGACTRIVYNIEVSYTGTNSSTGETINGEYPTTRTAVLQTVCPADTIPDPQTGACIPICSEEAGMSGQVGLVSSSAQSSTCFGQCQYTRDPGPSVCLDGDMCMAVYSLSGGMCGEGAPESPEGDCISDGGTMFCADDLPGGENCGSINGSGVCLGDIPDGKCTFLAGGGMVCDGDAPNQPTNPDGMGPAAPDATGTDVNGDPWNYYGEGTVGDSGTPVFGDGAPDSWGDENGDQDDDGGTCDPETEECDGEGSVSGGEFCDVPPSCEGDPLQCEIINQSWLERCADFEATDAEILAAAGLDEVGPGDFAARDDIDVSAMLDDSGLGWSRTCIDDVTITLAMVDATIVIPLSELCWLFELVGTLVVMGAAYTSYRIVLGGNK